jgi:molecular chaperone DnaJ
MATKRCYYEVLQVARTASDGEISSSYRKLAVKFHPDKNPGDDEAIVKFKEAAEAYEVLSDKDKRARYDRFGHAGVDGPQGGSPHFSDVNDIFEAFGDIFGDMFGGRGGGSRGRRVQQGADVRADVSLDLLEAARGVNKEIVFNRHAKCGECGGNGAKKGSKPEKCRYCGGRGQVVQSTGIFRLQTTCPACQGSGTTISDPCDNCRGEGVVLDRVTREVPIPAGVDSGTRLRISGEGDPGPSGGPPGDCYLFITVREHPLFQRDGQHLVCSIPVAYAQVALGTTIEVPTLDGKEDLRVPAGTQPGEVFRLKGRGMPDPRVRGRGDILVHLHLEIPTKLTKRQQELLRELAEEEKLNVGAHRKSFFDKLKDYFTTGEAEKKA